MSAKQVHEVYLLFTSGREAVILGVIKESICCSAQSICLSFDIRMIFAFISSLNLGAGILNLLHHAVDTIIFKAAVGCNIHLATGKRNIGSRGRAFCFLATGNSDGCSIIQLAVKHGRIDECLVVYILVIVIALAGNLHLGILNNAFSSDIKIIFGIQCNTLPYFYISSIAFHCNAHTDASAHEICQLIPRFRLSRRRRCRRCVKLILQLLRRVFGVSQPFCNTVQNLIFGATLTNKRIYCLAAFDIGNKALHKERRTHSIIGTDSIIRQNIFCINRQFSICTAYVTIDVDICLAVVIGYVDSSSNNSLFTCAYLCLGNHTVYRFRFNVDVILQISHLRSLANGNTALVVTCSDIQSNVERIGVISKSHGGVFGFAVHLAVSQGSNGRAALGFKCAININCCLIMCFTVGYSSCRNDIGACHIHNLQQRSAGTCASFHAAVRLDIQRRLYNLTLADSIATCSVDNSILTYVDLGLAVQNCIGSIKISCECADDIRSNVVGVQHTAFRAHITVHCIGSNINLLCFNLAINIYSSISSNNLPIKMGIGSSGGSIIFFILVGFFNFNIVQRLCAQLGLACSIYYCALSNAKLGINAFPGNVGKVILNTIVIIIIVIGCKNDIATAIFSSLKRLACQTGVNFTNVDNILKINNTSTNRRTRCRCTCSYITDIIFTYIFAHANLGSTQINSVNGINLA